MVGPGAVVTLLYPGAVKTKARPAVVVSTDLYHSTRPDMIVALLTTDLVASTQPTDYILQDWAAAGLHLPSAFRAFLATRPVTDVRREVGRLSDRDWQEVQARLRLALAVT
jgi:mRNA interferase MazF